MKKIKLLLIIVASVCLAIPVCAIITDHPSDSSLKAQFKSRRMQFEELHQMAAEDSRLWRVSFSWYRDKSGRNYENVEPNLLTDERWKKYRELFRKLHLDSGVSIEDGNVYFLISSSGIVGSGSSKGIAFIGSKGGAKSTGSNAPHGVTYTPIEGNWFIFEDW